MTGFTELSFIGPLVVSISSRYLSDIRSLRHWSLVALPPPIVFTNCHPLWSPLIVALLLHHKIHGLID